MVIEFIVLNLAWFGLLFFVGTEATAVGMVVSLVIFAVTPVVWAVVLRRRAQNAAARNSAAAHNDVRPTSEEAGSGRAVSVTGAGPGSGRRVDVLLAIFDFPMIVAAYRAVVDAQPDMAVVAALDDRATLRDEVTRTPADVVITECVPYRSPGAPRSRPSRRSGRRSRR